MLLSLLPPTATSLHFKGKRHHWPLSVCLSRSPLRLMRCAAHPPGPCCWLLIPIKISPLSFPADSFLAAYKHAHLSYLKIALRQASPLQPLLLKIIYILFLPFLSSHSCHGPWDLVQAPGLPGMKEAVKWREQTSDLNRNGLGTSVPIFSWRTSGKILLWTWIYELYKIGTRNNNTCLTGYRKYYKRQYA